jgi:hypothetical protein
MRDEGVGNTYLGYKLDPWYGSWWVEAYAYATGCSLSEANKYLNSSWPPPPEKEVAAVIAAPATRGEPKMRRWDDDDNRTKHDGCDSCSPRLR